MEGKNGMKDKKKKVTNSNQSSLTEIITDTQRQLRIGLKKPKAADQIQIVINKGTMD